MLVQTNLAQPHPLLAPMRLSPVLGPREDAGGAHRHGGVLGVVQQHAPPRPVPPHLPEAPVGVLFREETGKDNTGAGGVISSFRVRL